MTTPIAKQVCLKILDYLETKEDETTKKWRVWAHNEFDSNQTNFEMLSNQRAIGLVTTLKGKHLGALMRIFQSMFDRNFYVFGYLVESKDFSIDMSGRQLFRRFCKHPEVNIEDEGCNEKNATVCVEYDIRLMKSMLR